MPPEDASNPGDNPAPPTGNGDNPPAPQPTPNGSEPETNPGGDGATVPSDRLREETRKRREAEERAAELERQLSERGNPDEGDDPSNEDEDVDPEVEQLITKTLEKKGYVKKEDLQALEGRRQYEKDTADLTAKYANSSVPFVAEDVRQYAKENGINITNRASMEAAYRDMNFDKITDAAKKAAITEFKEGGKMEAERTGGSDGKPHEPEPEVRGLKNRIHAATQRIKA